MVGWLRDREGWRLFPQVTPTQVLGYPLLAVSLPPGNRDRRLGQGARALRRRGVRRVAAAPGWVEESTLTALGLEPVDPLPLCRVKGADLALFLLRDVPLRDRRVSLRGEGVDGTAFALADALCPQVGGLLLDFDRGEEDLAGELRARYGAAPLHLSPNLPPQVSVELAPRPFSLGRTLRLWGEPDLGGLALAAPEELPPGLDGLVFLTLLWESGRVRKEEIPVTFALDRREENPYNTQ